MWRNYWRRQWNKMKLREIRDILDCRSDHGRRKSGERDKVRFCGRPSQRCPCPWQRTGGSTLLITGIIHPQVIYAGNTFDLGAIIFVRGKRPNEATLQLAIENQIPLLATPYIMFETCGRLYQHGLRASIAKVKNG